MNDILIAIAWFLALGGVLGLLLAAASRIFRVNRDARIDEIVKILPGANCGGCGYAGCANYAEAIVGENAKCNKCVAGGDKVSAEIAQIMGTSAEKSERFRAQVMCSGTNDLSRKKFIHDGIRDCVAANKLAGGDKMCPNGCIGLGTCASVCPFDAISIINGVAAVNYNKCQACGACVAACPKQIIRLIPFDSKYWVGCMSVDKGAKTRSYCDVGCISCKLCEKNCPTGAIHVDNFVSHIDYSKCIGCGKCESVCPRKIIWSAETQEKRVIIDKKDLGENDAEEKAN